MLRKFTAATAIAGVALGAMLAASPVFASSHGGGQQFNQNLQLVPVQICNAQLSVGLAGVTVPILSPQTTGDCVNGPASTNVQHDSSEGRDSGDSEGHKDEGEDGGNGY
ncbi:hypothetical protein KGD83_26275 [Nocardiopsis akebiae]|uniref:Chaplin domain-containing protein n=1 Tax=Nocardiopsis akebiae TaxID=2831968 RepID=A0ABX8C711_9ACTN|nr:hypothetical protein [Nocardiopsis akebiae]QUX28678.1 hypothetical protein KGD83_26275 [Nocardiopsis akebiae]